MSSLVQFIRDHQNEDAAKLLLSRGIAWPILPEQFEDCSVKDIVVNTISGRRKIRTKLPVWYEQEGIIYPTRLSTEQCSSEVTAAVKASLCEYILCEKGIGSGKGKIADLTSGLGVDVWAFSSIAKRVLYNDMDKSLFWAAKNNFSLLGKDNIDLCNQLIDNDSIDSVLSGEWTSPDIIFLDPARRSETGKKVFLLEDCSPDVLGIMGKLLSHCKDIVLKLSPMADITMVVERLLKADAPVREVHVVSSEGECKELLIWIDSLWKDSFQLIIHEDNGGLLRVKCTSESESIPTFLRSSEDFENIISTHPYLFEPGKSLTKAGLFSYVSEAFSVIKAGKSTHLYFMSKDKIEDSSLTRLGKVYLIKEALPLSGKTVKQTGKAYPKSEVSAKNIPMTSDELRKKLGVKSGDDAHIFGIRIDFSSQTTQNVLLVTDRVYFK